MSAVVNWYQGQDEIAQLFKVDLSFPINKFKKQTFYGMNIHVL